ncbi:hypothetical protein EDB83DRAFT_2673770 [Lactarius deliciosus]|nr:hypothetical protein EDB83DRAFT_2673770 [Lactarius deliciosus]
MALSRTYHHYDTFREELAKAYPAFGHALWEPNPGEYPPVEVGDVGFVRQGKFLRLFNALYSEIHPSNQRFGVPEDHEQLQPIPNHIDRGALNPNTFYSYGVSVVSGGLEALATGSIGSAEVSFSCTKKQGAVLTLPVTAQREDTLTQDHFREWIIMHIDSWFAFAQKLRLGIEMRDIILVTGNHRTRSWSNITFNEVQTDAQFSLGVDVAGTLGASVNWRASSLRIQGAVPNHGPSGENLPENQCIFIRGFRIKRTFLGKMPRIRAAAEPKPDPRKRDHDPEEEVISIPSVTEYQDPLHVLLDYIAKRAPNCDMALVHDDDLERILGVGDSACLELSKPDMVMDYLERSKLEIVESRPLPTDDQSPGTDTERMTVAMLSVQLDNFDIVDTVQRAPLCDMDLVHDDNRERVLGTGDRTSLETFQPDATMDSLSREPDVGASPDTMDLDELEMSNFVTRAIFEDHSSINNQIPGINTDTFMAMTSLRLRNSAAGTSGHLCKLCGKPFGRPQDLRRHESQQHTPPRHCPFCSYQWTRPDKLKTHVLTDHHELPAEVLTEIRARRGMNVFEFLETLVETYQHICRYAPQAGGSSAPLFPASTEETTNLPILPHPLLDYDISGASPTALFATSLEPRASP